MEKVHVKMLQASSKSVHTRPDMFILIILLMCLNQVPFSHGQFKEVTPNIELGWRKYILKWCKLTRMTSDRTRVTNGTNI